MRMMKSLDYGEKIETHRLGQLHRRLFCFIFDKTSGKMLIQRRALKKYIPAVFGAMHAVPIPIKMKPGQNPSGDVWEKN